MSFRQSAIRLGTAFALLVGLVSVGQSQSGGPREPLDASWSRPAPNVVTLAVSPDGQRVVAGDAAGLIRCFDSRGSVLWERVVPGSDRLVTSRRGRLTVVFAARQPLATTVSFLDDGGRPIGEVDAGEPITTAIVAPGGEYAAVAAGRRVLFCARRLDGFAVRELRAAGQVAQVQFGPGDSLYVASRSPECVERFKSNGKLLWRHQGRGATGYSISASEDGKLLAVGSGLPDSHLELALIDSSRRLQWSTRLPGRHPRVRLCAAGTALIVTYERRVETNQRVRFERRLAYFGGRSRSWSKGGPFQAPLCVSIDRDGEWVVALDVQPQDLPHFRLFGSVGERRWLYSSPAGILIATASSEGRHIAAYREDGMIELVRVSVP